MNLGELDASKFGSLLASDDDEAPLSIPNVHLPLPEHLSVLEEQTSSLITTLFVFKRRRLVPAFSKIRDAIENQTRHSYTEHQLCQSLRILPDNTIETQWQEDGRKRLPHYLVLNLVTSQSISELDTAVHQYLIDFVKMHHRKFLREKQIIVRDVQQWHADFDLSTVPHVHPVTLPPPVIKQQIDITQAFQRKMPRPETVAILPPEETTNIPVPKSCANLSSYFAVAKLVQERAAQKEQITSNVSERHTTELTRLSDLLNTIFHSKRKSSLPLPDIMMSISKNDFFKAIDPVRQRSLLEELIDKSDSFWTRIELRGITYIQMQSQSRTYQMAKGVILRNIMATSEPTERLPRQRPVIEI